jgi:hypothetical protein
MANNGPNSNGSQFFITLDDQQDRLNYKHSVFGKVIQGMDSVQRIREGDLIESVEIIRLGEAAKRFESIRATWTARLEEFPRIPEPAIPFPFFHDFAGLDYPAWFPSWIAQKLYNYEVSRGVSVYIRTFQTFLPAADGETPQQFSERLATMMGYGKANGQRQFLLALYFADTETWALYATPRLYPKLFQQPGETPGPEDWNRLLDTLEQRARSTFEEGTPRRMVDGLATQILLQLDRNP